MAVTFTDADGAVWSVWEVSNRTLRGVPGERPLRGEPGDAGWLCFLSVRGKRRLLGYPPFWELLSGEALERLCERAQPVPCGELRAFGDAVAHDASPNV